MKLPSLKKIKWKKKLWLFAVIGGLGLAFYLFASSKSEVVETALCKAGRMEEYISLQGKAELDDLSYIYARTSGIVTELLLEEGEKVESGQIAAKLDGEDVSFAVGKLSAALGQAQAALQASRQQAEQAASYGEKMEQLYLAGGNQQTSLRRSPHCPGSGPG